jgi:hypothetical protein
VARGIEIVTGKRDAEVRHAGTNTNGRVDVSKVSTA